MVMVRPRNLHFEHALRGSDVAGPWIPSGTQRSRELQVLPLGLAVANLGCPESSQRPSEFVQKESSCKSDDFLASGSGMRTLSVFSLAEGALSPVLSKPPLESCP